MREVFDEEKQRKRAMMWEKRDDYEEEKSNDDKRRDGRQEMLSRHNWSTFDERGESSVFKSGL